MTNAISGGKRGVSFAHTVSSGTDDYEYCQLANGNRNEL
jgi:hypothetical protein